MSGWARRLLGTLAALSLLAGPASRGLCFMQATPSDDPGGRSAHDCCKAGLQSTPPACCMSSMAADVPGRLPAKLVVEGVAGSVAPLVPAAEPVHQRLAPVAFPGAPHLKASPPLVLRI